MKIKLIEIKKVPVLIVDDFFTENESQEILEELIKINSSFMEDPKLTGSAFIKDDLGNRIYKKKAKGLFLDEYFENKRSESNILKINRKLFDDDIVDKFIEKHFIFNYVRFSNRDTTVLHYYEDNDYYKFHGDVATISALSWHYFEPKRFLGGNIFFDEIEQIKIECFNRRLVLFPSFLQHSVEKISMENNFQNMNLGRYSMAQFIFINNQ